MFTSLFHTPFGSYVGFLLGPLLIVFSTSLALIFFVYGPSVGVRVGAVPRCVIRRVRSLFFSSFKGGHVGGLRASSVSLFVIRFYLQGRIYDGSASFFRFGGRALFMLFRRYFQYVGLERLVLFRGLGFCEEYSGRLLFSPLLRLPCFLL